MKRATVFGPFAAALILAACSVLAGCTPAPGGDAPASPTPPTDAPAGPAPAAGGGFARPINAVGTEPFWGLDIRPGQLKLSGPDRKDLIAPHAGPQIQGDTAVWEGKSADGAPLKVTLMTEACSDGMSDLSYPYRARIEATAEVLTGCAAPVDAWPKQPDSAADGSPAAQ